MALPASDTTRPGLRFTLFGFPIHIDTTFFLIIGLFGLGGRFDLARLLVWIGVATLSVLVHELGHAFAARPLGSRPSIQLYGMGGVTSFTPRRPMSRLQSIGVSLAGPMAGLATWLIVSMVSDRFGPIDNDTVRYGVAIAIWVNLAWSALNLLPVLPLDGGHVLENLIPGDPALRRHRAAWVSVVVGAAAALVLWRGFNLVFGGMLFGFLALSNWQQVKGARAVSKPPPIAPTPEQAAPTLTGDDRAAAANALRTLRTGDLSVTPALERLATSNRIGVTEKVKAGTVVALLAQGHSTEAAHAMTAMPPSAVDEALQGLTEVYAGDPDAVTRVRRAFRARPGTETVRILLHAQHRLGLDHESAPLLATTAGASDSDIVLEAQEVAYTELDDMRLAADLGELALSGYGAQPVTYYNTAAALARSGRPDRALDRLEKAVTHGWSDLSLLDSDPDLASLRTSPRFALLRSQVADPHRG